MASDAARKDARERSLGGAALSSFARHFASARSWRLRGTAMRFTVR